MQHVWGALKDGAGSNPRVAFVLSGGGPMGCLQVGVLEALLEYGIYPDLIVGTSVGALNGAWLARRPDREGLRGLSELWRSLTGDTIFRGGRLRVLFRMVSGRDYLYPDQGLRALMAQNVGDTRFEQLAVPLFVTAVDLNTAELEVIHEGGLIPALLASTAIPGVLPPVTIGGRMYVDGGILDYCPFDVAWELGATHIVAIECPHAPPTNAYGFLGPIAKALWVAQVRLRSLGVQRFQDVAGVPMLRLVPPMEIRSYNRKDFSRTRELMDQAKTWAEDYLRQNADAFPRALRRGNPSLPASQPELRPVGEQPAFPLSVQPDGK
ncbi:MAG: patatin-like phospholipase family protein [Chloroflexi bacterium]|nr:patatin-like phospholipase family protein [Chloroflexota bacterium]